MITLSARTLAVCRTYWRTLADGRPAATCCVGCPLLAPRGPCGAAVGAGRDALEAHTAALNAAAELAP